MPTFVQRAVICRMSAEQREGIFLLSIAILAANLPETYSTDIGHQVAFWTKCENILPHVESIMSKGAEFNIFQGENQQFAELLLRYSWCVQHIIPEIASLMRRRYLYERENYSVSRSCVGIALQKFVNKDSLAYASAVDLGGLIDLDICHPSAALEAFQQAYTIRRSILPSDDLFLAASQVNLGLALTEIGEFEKSSCLSPAVNRYSHHTQQ